MRCAREGCHGACRLADRLLPRIRRTLLDLVGRISLMSVQLKHLVLTKFSAYLDQVTNDNNGQVEAVGHIGWAAP
jgi:hypothetical protein